MEDMSIFVKAIDPAVLPEFGSGALGHRVQFHSTAGEIPPFRKGALVIIGCPESRRSSAVVTPAGLLLVRSCFYGLQDHFPDMDIIDVGDILPGNTVDDTYFALSSTVAAIVKAGAVALVIGGGQDLTYANYLAYQKLEQVVNIVTVDSRFDMGAAEEDVSASAFLQRIVLNTPNVLFNYSNLAYQTYYASLDQVDMMHRMFFDVYRLGEVQTFLEGTEPVIRNADMASFDLTAIRSSDNPSNHRSEPNGLYGEEACAICRYAGLSDKLSSFGVYEFDENRDADGRGAMLAGQMLWYFAWGVANRKRDYPLSDRDENTKYTVTIEDGSYDIVFYKSPRSDRWWMEVPYPSKRGQRYERHFMVPCSYADYEMACANEMPDRWWQTYQKLG